MNTFDKICAVLAFPLGIVLLILGAIGVFIGCKASFTLPPILGIVPGLVGWGVIRAVIVAWRQPRRILPHDEVTPMERIEPLRPSDNPYDAPQY